MTDQAIQILVVDDDEFIRDILEMMLSDEGYVVTLACDGEEAWKILDSNQHHFSAILLDRIMPRLDGMGLLARIKADSRFVNLPVVFQTGIDHPSEVAESIKAGAFYYLIKPVNRDVLLAIVQSAVNTFSMGDNLNLAVNPVRSIFADLLLRSELQLSTLLEARTLANALSAFYPQPQRVALGISELLINAVEHGNLGISYQEKSGLLRQGGWEDEIARRLTLPENVNKKVNVKLEHTPLEMSLLITDCGAGFEYKNYLEMSPERAFDPNGRGIAMSRMMSFDTLEYKGKGNQVVAGVKI